MKPGPEADRFLLAHMRDCLDRIVEYTHAERSRFDGSRLVQDAVIRNLQTMAESSQRLSREIEGTAADSMARTCRVSQRDRAWLLGVDLGAVWLIVEQDLPSLTEAVNRMATRLGPQG